MERKYKNQLGKIICNLRKKNPGLSQRELAKQLEISNAALSDIENGNIFPSSSLLLKMIDLLNPCDDLLEKIYQIYSKAKDVPPPDITFFLRDKPDLHKLLRRMQGKNVTTVAIDTLNAVIDSLDDTKDMTV